MPPTNLELCVACPRTLLLASCSRKMLCCHLVDRKSMAGLGGSGTHRPHLKTPSVFLGKPGASFGLQAETDPSSVL